MPALQMSFIGLVVLVSACVGPAAPVASPTPPSAFPVPTGQASLTTMPTETPGLGDPTFDAVGSQMPIDGSWAQNPPTPLLMGSAVRVLIAELNVHERPSTSAPRVGTVTPDNILVVDSLPFEADGYIWYSGRVVSATGELDPLPEVFVGAGENLSGWFAAMKGSTASVARVEPRCPAVVDLRNVAAMLPAERLACFVDRSIEVQGTFGCSACSSDIYGRWEPLWLRNPNDMDLLWEVPMESSPLRMRFSPTGPAKPALGSIIRTRGHFNDAAAAGCSMAVPYPWDTDDTHSHQVPAVVARELCRQEFVVERYDILGTDPSFSAG